MQIRTNKAILERIKAAAKTKKMSDRKVSLEAGLGPDAIRDLKRKPEVLPRIDTILSLAGVLEVDPGRLAFGDASVVRSQPVPTLRVIGEVAAGLWHDVASQADEGDFGEYAIPVDPRYASDAQFGLIVRGTSINRVALPKDILICVDLGMGGIEATDNDLVIVERRRAQGGEKEVTAKRWRRRGRTIELVPDSDDERWKEPLILDPKKAKDGDEVVVVAIVIGVYKSLR
jgi:SOS-response transcriptional repressor LexA